LTTPTTTWVGPSWLVTGYRRALDRFHATSGARTEPMERFIPRFETLNWAAAFLDPKAEARIPHLYPRLNVDDTVQGLRYVRNSLHHQWAEALDPRDVIFPRPLVVTGRGTSGPMGPIPVLDWFWKPLDDLPSRAKKHFDKLGRDAYPTNLADQPRGFRSTISAAYCRGSAHPLAVRARP
jgi:hypothetical protein